MGESAGWFVEEPRSVEQADHLVAEAMKRLAEVFAEDARTSSANGIAAKMFRPKTCALRFGAFFERLLAV